MNVKDIEFNVHLWSYERRYSFRVIVGGLKEAISIARAVGKELAYDEFEIENPKSETIVYDGEI